MSWNRLGTPAQMWWSLAGLVILVAVPLLVTLAAALIAAMLGCRLDESGVHPCPLFGIDIGQGLYMFGMMFWFGLFALPIAAIGLVVWLGFAIALLVRRRRRSTSA